MSTHPKIGEFNGKVNSILINISENKPAIFTRISFVVDNVEQMVSHSVKLDKPDNLRIGLDELRSAFPTQLANLTNEQLVSYLIEKTDSFNGLPVIVSIELQKDANTGIVKKNPKNNEAYFNVRLRSGVKNLTADDAKAMAKRLLSLTANKAAIATAFKNTVEAPKTKTA